MRRLRRRALQTLALSAILGAAFAAPAAAETLKVGILKLASSGAVFIAAEEGYFTAEGIEPSLVYFDAAQPVAVAAVSGDIDVGVTGLTAGFYNLAGKGALRIIGAQSREERQNRCDQYYGQPGREPGDRNRYPLFRDS